MMLLHHASSTLAIIACWWLVHVNAQNGAWGKAIALGYALLAIALTAAAFGRSWHLPYPGMDLILIASKLALAAVLFMVAIRREFIERR